MHELRLDFINGADKTSALLGPRQTPDLSLRDFLTRFPACAGAPIPLAWLDLPLREFDIRPWKFGPDAVPALPTGGAAMRSELDSLRAAYGDAAPPPCGDVSPPASAYHLGSAHLPAGAFLRPLPTARRWRRHTPRIW